MTNIFQLPQATFIPNRAIDTFTAYVTIEEICTDELEITEHPIEQGASISDHAYVKPAVVNMKVLFGYGITTLNFENPIETYSKILQLQATRETFRIVTGKRAYNNMLIKRLTETNDSATESVLSLNLTFQELFIVSVTTTTSVFPQNQDEPESTESIQNAGEKSPQEVAASTSVSILNSGAAIFR